MIIKNDSVYLEKNKTKHIELPEVEKKNHLATLLHPPKNILHI